EEGPSRCHNGLMIVVRSQVKAGLTAGSRTIESPAAKPQMRQRLRRIQQLANDFGLDVQPTERNLAAMNESAADIAGDAVNIGKSLLDKARIEIQRGQFEIARQLATEVHNGPYQCQAEATAILRTIAAEELTQ